MIIIEDGTIRRYSSLTEVVELINSYCKTKEWVAAGYAMEKLGDNTFVDRSVKESIFDRHLDNLINHGAEFNYRVALSLAIACSKLDSAGDV